MKKTCLIYKGALTNHLFAFKSRAWELGTFMALDLSTIDGRLLNVSYRGNKVLKVLPQSLKWWLTDEARYFICSLLEHNTVRSFNHFIYIGGVTPYSIDSYNVFIFFYFFFRKFRLLNRRSILGKIFKKIYYPLMVKINVDEHRDLVSMEQMVNFNAFVLGGEIDCSEKFPYNYHFDSVGCQTSEIFESEQKGLSTFYNVFPYMWLEHRESNLHKNLSYDRGFATLAILKCFRFFSNVLFSSYSVLPLLSILCFQYINQSGDCFFGKYLVYSVLGHYFLNFRSLLCHIPITWAARHLRYMGAYHHPFYRYFHNRSLFVKERFVLITEKEVERFWNEKEQFVIRLRANLNNMLLANTILVNGVNFLRDSKSSLMYLSYDIMLHQFELPSIFCERGYDFFKMLDLLRGFFSKILDQFAYSFTFYV